MKNTRKLLILLLAIAISVACFSIPVFADDSVVEDTEGENSGAVVDPEVPVDNEADYQAALKNHKDVLEYYEAGSYLNVNFDSFEDFEEAMASGSEEFAFMKGGAFSSSIVDGAATITSINPTKFVIDPEKTGSFGINIRAKVTDSSSIALYVSAAGGDYLSLFNISVGKIAHKFDPSSLAYEVDEEIAIVADEYFNVELFLTKGLTEDQVSFTVTTDGGAAQTYSYSYANDTTDFLNGKFKFDTAYLSTSNATFKYIEMYPGSFARKLDNSENVSLIAADILDAYADYQKYSALVESKAFELAEIIANLAVTYDFYDVSVKSACENAVKVVSAAYNEELNGSVAEINKETNATKDYNERLATVNIALKNKDFLLDVLNGSYSEVAGFANVTVSETLVSNLSIAEAELTALEDIEANMVATIEAVSVLPNVYLANYKEYKVAYEAFNTYTVYESFSNDEYSAEVVAQALITRKVILAEYPKIDAKAKIFVDNVVIAIDENNAFADRYNAYITAKDNFFADSSYDEYLTDVTIAELVAAFESTDIEMTEVSAVAEEFLAKIQEAVLTPSYSVKIVALDAAQPYIDIVEKGYPGVAEAIDNYYVLRKDITDRTEATKRYILAVLNVQIAKTVKEKLIAIEIADTFALLGNDVSVEVTGMAITVTEANVILSNERSAISLEATRINNYVEAVNSISTNAPLLERRKAINKAYAMKASLNPEEEDVEKATEILDAIIAAYNAEVNSANAEADTADNVALSVLTKTAPTKRIAEVVAIIKKFYE